MFAPLIAKPKTKPAGSVPAPRSGQSAAARPQILPTGLGNQATSRILARWHTDQRAGHSARRLLAPELAHFIQQRFAANASALRRQPTPDIQSPSAPVETTVKVQYHGHEGDDLAIKLLELADKGNRNSALYLDAIRASGPLEKRYVYRNPYTLDRLADILDLASFDQCVSSLDADSRGRVLAGMARIKKKYGLGEVSEDGARWSEGELKITDTNFSKMTTREQAMLRGLRLIRKDKVESEERHGKKFSIAGRTTGGHTMELTENAFRGPIPTILHEAGHLIQQKQPLVAKEALEASKTFTDLDPAAQALAHAVEEANKATASNPAFPKSLNQMTAAVNALVKSQQESVQANKDQLNMAAAQLDLERMTEHSKPWLDAHDRLSEYANAVEQWATRKQEIESAPADIEKSFVDIVKKHKLDTRSFAPFTDYVAHSWPDKPQEFLVQSYATWRANPGYLRSRAPKLAEWFESGGHLMK
jgi:hypothetical protein